MDNRVLFIKKALLYFYFEFINILFKDVIKNNLLFKLYVKLYICD